MPTIYLDFNSTTPVDQRVLEQMLPWFSEKFGNAASKTHRFGWEADAAVTHAREKVASLIGAESNEIIFTSGATEAINLALRGVMDAYADKGNHFIVCRSEHKAVLDTAAALADKGKKISYLSVSRDGRIDLDELKKVIQKETVMVAIMMANNETGVIQDVEAIGGICKENGIIFFSDLTQATGKININVRELGISIACISAHKIYGPKGVGALYVSRKNPRVILTPQITGGGHEKGLRSGTLNVPGIVGFGAAAELAQSEIWDYSMHTSMLRTKLEQGIEEVGNIRINGSTRYRLSNTTNLQIGGIKADALIQDLHDIAISSGSACSSALSEPSHVLRGMGLTEQESYSSIRLSLGKTTTDTEINYVIEKIILLVKKIRNE